TAWALLDAGYDVTIIAEQWADPKNCITSQIAGALWEFPPAVCGKHTDVISLHNSKRWCMTAYRVFDKLQEIMPKAITLTMVSRCASPTSSSTKQWRTCLTGNNSTSMKRSLLRAISKESDVMPTLYMNTKSIKRLALSTLTSTSHQSLIPTLTCIGCNLCCL
ncbi:hypothetical protein CPB85DRAFT_1470623, partial [Mucidula mucida]